MEEPENGLEDMRRVLPVHRVESPTGKYAQEYSYGDIYIESADLPIEISNRKFFEGEYGIWSLYPSKPDILISDGDLYARSNISREKAQNQAYFTVSILASNGMASRFVKE